MDTFVFVIIIVIIAFILIWLMTWCSGTRQLPGETSTNRIISPAEDFIDCNCENIRDGAICAECPNCYNSIDNNGIARCLPKYIDGPINTVNTIVGYPYYPNNYHNYLYHYPYHYNKYGHYNHRDYKTHGYKHDYHRDYKKNGYNRNVSNKHGHSHKR